MKPSVFVTKKKSTTLTLPVGCTQPAKVAAPVDSGGNLPASAFTVLGGTVGPPASGNDSSGASGATDAANYPCPPYVSQAGTNACEIDVIEPNGMSASASITFAGSNSTPNPTIAPTTTTAPCNASNGQIIAPVAGVTTGTGTATVDQPGGAAPTSSPQAATCLLGGDVVQVAATGLSVGNNGSATVIECNNAPGQPTIDFAGHPIPVSCTAIGSNTIVALTSNNLPAQSFTIVQGITGPPVAGPDSAGNSAATDAGSYPCPPTPAQATAGDSCVIAVGTAYLSGSKASDQLPVPISFNLNAIAAGGGTVSNNATKAGSSGTTTTIKAKKASSTKASSSSLAFTGTGPGLWWLGSLGVLLMVFGGLVLVVVDGPRRFLRFAVDHGRRSRGEETG